MISYCLFDDKLVIQKFDPPMIFYLDSILGLFDVCFGLHLCKNGGLFYRFQHPAPEENVIEELEMEFHPDVAAAA